MSKTLLSVKGINKSFPGVKALSDVSFTMGAGQIHALMGENGAGKSTLIKVLTGVYRSDSGTLEFDGKPIAPDSTRDAEDVGISTVYQEVNLIPHLSVAENITLGRQAKRFGFIDWKNAHVRAEKALARLNVNIDVKSQLSSLSVAQQQLVAIARALDVDAKMLILDEPTASLDEGEVQQLFEILLELKKSGLAIIFITHFLDEVYQVSDVISILRNGEFVGQYPTKELPKLELIGKMLGKEFNSADETDMALKQDDDQANDTERAHWFSAKNLTSREIGMCDLSVQSSTITGIAGLLGSGRTELARLLFAVDDAETGELQIDEQAVSFNNPRDAIKNKLAFCSEDRKAEGIIPNLSVRENILLAIRASRSIFNSISKQQQVELAEKFIKLLRIKTPSTETPIKNLSGGNQQKVLLARWLVMEPRLLILDEPTRGIDIGARAEIEALINDLCEQGLSVLLIASELEELVRVCHNLVVMKDRKKIGELDGKDVNEHKIMQLIAS